MPDDPRSVVLRWFDEVWSRRREAAIDELLRQDSICHADTGDMRGPDEFRDKMFKPFVAAFPDLQVVIEDLIAEGERVAVRWSAKGTHRGSDLGFEKTERPVELQGITLLRVEQGKLVEGWQTSNIGDVLTSLRNASGGGAPPA